LTVAEVARRYRVSPDKVRTWIKSGRLVAVNTAARLCGKPRFVMTPEALRAFELGAAACPPPKAPKRQKRIKTVDYYPD
jgi:excisionase family DNA binding protein